MLSFSEYLVEAFANGAIVTKFFGTRAGIAAKAVTDKGGFPALDKTKFFVVPVADAFPSRQEPKAPSNPALAKALAAMEKEFGTGSVQYVKLGANMDRSLANHWLIIKTNKGFILFGQAKNTQAMLVPFLLTNAGALTTPKELGKHYSRWMKDWFADFGDPVEVLAAKPTEKAYYRGVDPKKVSADAEDVLVSKSKWLRAEIERRETDDDAFPSSRGDKFKIRKGDILVSYEYGPGQSHPNFWRVEGYAPSKFEGGKPIYFVIPLKQKKVSERTEKRAKQYYKEGDVQVVREYAPLNAMDADKARQAGGKKIWASFSRSGDLVIGTAGLKNTYLEFGAHAGETITKTGTWYDYGNYD